MGLKADPGDRSNPDPSSWAGTILGAGAILGGHFLGGGALGQILRPDSAFIVLGGTLAAVSLANPAGDLRLAATSIRGIYRRRDPRLGRLAEEILRMASIARKEGLLVIEQHRAGIGDPLLRVALKHVTDGLDPVAVRELVEARATRELERDETAARVFEGAGAFAPALGIIGAVLGLIQVMSLLGDSTRLGEGLAGAFVSTLYGLGLSYLVLLPWGGKLRRRAAEAGIAHQMVLTGVQGIQLGVSPHLLHEQLEIFLRREPGDATPQSST